MCVNRKNNDNQKTIIKKKNILKNKIRRWSDFGVWRRFGIQKNKKYIQTLYFCILMYMNYFNKVVYVMYIRVESNNIKATIIKSNVQKNDNQKNNILKNKIRRWSDFGVWRRFGNSKK